jgi:conjugative transposon TraM protein
MKINLKQPKYVLPVILLPFLCLFFYVWHTSAAKSKKVVAENKGLNATVADVSPEVRKKRLTDKLDAYRNAYKEADGLSAVNLIPTDGNGNPVSAQSKEVDKQKKMLDSIDRTMRAKYRKAPGASPDATVSKALNQVMARQTARERPATPVTKEKDPMEMFKEQLAYMDSIQKQNDPAYKAEKLKQEKMQKFAQEKAGEIKLAVSKAETSDGDFNTVKPPIDDPFITAVVDENITGYAGSRLRLRLLDDIKVGNYKVGKGAFIYAEINGFTRQRVTLKVTSILMAGKILPVKLDVYDLDGLAGLYVPASAFRDFTKDLGSNSVQGISIDNSSGSFVMSTVGRMFQSTSSAIADMIRKNKAKIKYNSYIYLIDPDQLQNAQKKY